MNTLRYPSLSPNWGTLFSSDLGSHFALARGSVGPVPEVAGDPCPEGVSPQSEPEISLSETEETDAEPPVAADAEPSAEADAPSFPDLATVRQSAELGNSMAQYYLGALYSTGGSGVELDVEQAAFWYQQAAEQGLAMAQNNLGFLYATGQGVPQDYVMAHRWIKLAALGDYLEASDNLSILNRHMTPEQIEQAEQQVREWIESHGGASP